MAECVAAKAAIESIVMHLLEPDKSSVAVAHHLLVRTRPPRGSNPAHLPSPRRPQLGCYNISVCGRKMQTPHIDALAARGLTFRHAFTQYAVCSPSRNSCA